MRNFTEWRFMFDGFNIRHITDIHIHRQVNTVAEDA